jgi:hypothetical protein
MGLHGLLQGQLYLFLKARQKTLNRLVASIPRILSALNFFIDVILLHTRKRPPGRPRFRWVDNITIDLRYDRVVWTGFIWLRIGTNGGLL